MNEAFEKPLVTRLKESLARKEQGNVIDNPELNDIVNAILTNLPAVLEGKASRIDAETSATKILIYSIQNGNNFLIRADIKFKKKEK